MLFRNLLTKTSMYWSASRRQFGLALKGQGESQAQVSCLGNSSDRTGGGRKPSVAEGRVVWG